LTSVASVRLPRTSIHPRHSDAHADWLASSSGVHPVVAAPAASVCAAVWVSATFWELSTPTYLVIE
jgi:hypothetical protein